MHVERFVGREQRFIQCIGHFVGGESCERIVRATHGIDGDVVETAATLGSDYGEGGGEVGVGLHVDNDGWQMQVSRGRGAGEPVKDPFNRHVEVAYGRDGTRIGDGHALASLRAAHTFARGGALGTSSRPRVVVVLAPRGIEAPAVGEENACDEDSGAGREG